jgi:hypothetical protein
MGNGPENVRCILQFSSAINFPEEKNENFYLMKNLLNHRRYELSFFLS